MWFAIGKFIVVCICANILSLLIASALDAAGIGSTSSFEEISTVIIIFSYIVVFYIAYFSKSAKRARFERKLKKDKREAPYKIRRCSWCGNSFKMRDSGYEWHCSKRCYRQDN